MRLRIKNLPEGIRDVDVINRFGEYGKIKWLHLYSDRHECFITFKNPKAAKRAFEARGLMENLKISLVEKQEKGKKLFILYDSVGAGFVVVAIYTDIEMAKKGLEIAKSSSSGDFWLGGPLSVNDHDYIETYRSVNNFIGIGRNEKEFSFSLLKKLLHMLFGTALGESSVGAPFAAY